MIKNKKNFILILIILLIEILILISPDVLINSTKEALLLFINRLFISLFPFFVLNKILISYNLQEYLSKLKLNSNIIIIILSMISGMPSNAEYIKDALSNNIITIKEAERLLLISFFPSPVFAITIIGFIGFKNIHVGIILLLIVYLSNIILGMIIKNKCNNTLYIKTNINNNFMNILKIAISSSINSLLVILGNIIIFSIILGLIDNYLHLDIIINSILSSILELSNASKKVSLITNFNIKFSLSLFSLIFSGLSVFFQASSILSEYNINFKKIIMYKLITAIIFAFSSFVILSALNPL